MRTSKTWERCALPLAGLAALTAVAGCGAKGGSSAAADVPAITSSAAPIPSPDPVAPLPAPTTGLTPAPSPSSTTSPTSTTAPSPTVSPTPTHVGLQMGDKGPKVLALQKRLQAMGFWLSAADGSYGQTTEQAVMAFQKATGIGRDGVAGPLTMKAVLNGGLALRPRSTSGHWLEIDKTRQLLYIVDNGKISTILNTSTGNNQPYVQDGVTYLATTPSGEFSVFRQVDADDPGPLGDLWRPKYFNGGIAVHGSPSIPGYAASHGCARLSNPAIDWIWSSNQAPIGTLVSVY